jgi:phosphopantothenoylcysteine decarboxylase/phosphopantothenate--cysteine ligase
MSAAAPAPELVLGVTGGIAAYKTAALCSRLVQDGWGVTVVMTPAARRFIGPDTFAALTGRPVAKRRFGDPAYPLGAHIEVARRGQMLCIAPASADFLAKAAHGLAGDLLSTLYLAFQGPVIVAPAMNAAMWAHPAVQRNVERVRADGAVIVEPGAGWLSCRESGSGRMAEPEAIAAVLGDVWSRHASRST